ncbi:HEPN domain-containing protein [Candidatus Amesbacteria bacterium]|nr:HEPN domain-containing protein [Candidatus Amesbacteria bacterium]
MGILKALKEDIEQGYLTKIEDLVSAEIFTDFIEMAKHLLDNSYKDSAASLVGAVLENGLRQIAQKYTIDVKSGDDIGSLNTKLADKEIYNRFMQKQIQAWKAIRDSADHGKFYDYKVEDVKSFLDGVQRFLTENL